VPIGQEQRIVRDCHQGLQIGIDSPEQRPKVVVLPKECMNPPAHGDLIIAMSHLPGTHPATELLVRLHHDHRTPRSASPIAAAMPAMPPPATTTGLDTSVNRAPPGRAE
jgi:hypothetical protein